MNRPLLRLRPALIGILLAAATTALAISGARAQEAITLRGRPELLEDRRALLREELRERKHEIKEAIESARSKKARARGRKVEQVPTDSDLMPAQLRAGYFARPTGATSTTVAPTNTKANNKVGDAANAGQAEQSIAFLGLNGLCAWNDGQGFNLSPQDVQGYGWTNDGGATWTDGGIPLKGGTILTWSSDPVVTVNEKTGNFYYTGLTTNSGTNNNGVGVARGHFTAGVWGWDGVSMVAAGPSASQFFDKQWMCADSSNGNLYVTWTLFTTTGTTIFFSRSTDGGSTWSPQLQISGAWENGLVSGSRPMVGPNGEVYVIYTAIGPVDADSVKIAKSTNGGASFGPSVVGMVEYDNYFNGAPGFNRPRAVTFAAGAVDRSFGPNRGRVYLTVHDCVNFYGDPLGGGTSQSEIENNSGFANATAFTSGQTLRGSCASSTDTDNWKFPATQGTTYIFFVDSLRTTSFRYTMRLYCGNDTVAVSRVAFSGAQSTTSALNSHSLIVWTAPTTATYYLRMVPVTVGAGANPYRIRVGTHTPVVSDVARDTRDVVVASSADGVTGWTARARINDDLPYYDNWLPEIAVPCDGNVYAYWMDFRDFAASCFGGSNMYLTRSTNGGGIWAANQVASTAGTPNWTQVVSNIAPNQGDYNGIYGGDAIGLAWGDGRLGDADVFAARVPAGFTLADCPPSQSLDAGASFSGSVTLNNGNMMFANSYSWTLTCDAGWPGLPTGGSVGASAGGSTSIPVNFTVPGSAVHNSVAHFVLTVNCGGGCVQTCAFDITVINIATPTLASLSSSTAEPGRVALTWQVDGIAAATVQRSEDGVQWTDLGGAVAGGDGMLRYSDDSVRPGARYAYRLGFVSGGRDVYAGQGWVEVPAFTEFAVHGAFPNPAKAGFSVSFSLPSNAPATLELIDLAGRRVLSRQVGGLGMGRHTLALDSETGRLPIGVYGIRLSQSGKLSTGKVSIVR